MADQTFGKLPETAYRELKPGERYEPVVGADSSAPEITMRSVVFGTILCILLTVVMVYLTLKFGQGIEVAIPVAVLALGYSAVARRKSTPIESVNILAWGSTSGIVSSAACFVLPAFYMNKLGVSGFEMAAVLIFGSVLGVLFLIPYRPYFTTQMHGKFPFPEGTAIANILNSVSTGLQDTKRIAGPFAVGVALDYVGATFKPWGQVFSLQNIPGLDSLFGKAKVIFDMGTNATYVGLGYIMGIKFALQIAAGSFLMFFVFVPLIGGLAPGYQAMDAYTIFSGVPKDGIYGAKYIGIGAIFSAGIVSIIRMSPQIVQALRETIVQGLRRGSGQTDQLRTNQDIPLSVVGGLLAVVAVLMVVFLRYVVLNGEQSPWLLSVMSTIAVYVVVFLFSCVSAWAIAVISVTPVSGMTLVTLFTVALILLACGLQAGDSGQKAVLLIGTIACTAVSMAGSLVTQMKVGYWFGATPRKVEWSNIIASVLPAIISVAVIAWLASIYSFGARGDDAKGVLGAPQASAMAAVVGAVMGGKAMPWLFAGVGAAIAAITPMLGVSALALALGMFLPMEINVPIVFGALVGSFVRRSAGTNEKLAEARWNRGNLAATGLLAGGAMAGILTALTVWIAKASGRAEVPAFTLPDLYMNFSSLVPFIGVALMVYFVGRRVKTEEV